MDDFAEISDGEIGAGSGLYSPNDLRNKLQCSLLFHSMITVENVCQDAQIDLYEFLIDELACCTLAHFLMASEKM